MNTSRKISHFFVTNWYWIGYLVIFILSFVFFTWLQSPPSFADPDSFYHTEMSILIPQKGIFTTFPWLQATVLRDQYIDQHFLYHVLLIPFTRFLDPLWGVKLATVFFGSGLILLVYWLMRSQKIKLAFVFTMALLATMPFVFRINLVKEPAMAIGLLIIGLYCLFKYKYLALFFLSFAYVWAYGGFILIVVFAGIYALVSVLYDWWHHRPRTLMDILGHSREVRMFFICLAGILAGLVINPYFPQNLGFYWHQLVQIGIINYRSIISVGNEWYPYKFLDLTANTALVTILVLVSVLVAIIRYKTPGKKEITLFVIYIFFFIFTLKSRRYVEYYVPFGILFTAFALSRYINHLDWKRIWLNGMAFYTKHRIATTILIIYFLTTLPTVVIKDIDSTYNDFKNGISLSHFSAVSTWISQNAAPGEVVFHTSWDEFPELFYYNPQNYYIDGLDPTFTYEYDKTLYHEIVDITLGNQTTNLHQDIKDDFRASYVLAESGHIKMIANLRADSGFKQVYQDSEAVVFKVL